MGAQGQERDGGLLGAVASGETLPSRFPSGATRGSRKRSAEAGSGGGRPPVSGLTCSESAEQGGLGAAAGVGQAGWLAPQGAPAPWGARLRGLGIGSLLGGGAGTGARWGCCRACGVFSYFPAWPVRRCRGLPRWGSGRRQPTPQTCAARRGAHGEPQSARPSRRAGGRGARAFWKAPRRFQLSICPCAGAAAPLPGAHQRERAFRCAHGHTRVPRCSEQLYAQQPLAGKQPKRL